ncbi:MAG: PAS domain-containing protein [Pseudomonadota bacterium]
MTNGTGNDTVCIDFTRERLTRTTDMMHTQTRALFSYWDRLRAGRPLPFRAEIDPRDMDCDARNLFILESVGEGNIRFRLAGSAIADAFGMDLRGMSVRSIMGGRSRESIAALIDEVLAEPGVGYARLVEDTEAGTTWEILLLPLKSDFGAVDRIIGALYPIAGTPSKAGVSVGMLKFQIDEMSIRPVNHPVPQTSMPGTQPSELAEDQEPFEGLVPPSRLVSIEGGKARQGEDDTPRPRTHLRLVKDE